MTPELMRLLEYLAAFLLGAFLVWLMLRRQKAQGVEQGRAALASEVAILQERLTHIPILKLDLQAEKTARLFAESNVSTLTTQLSTLQKEHDLQQKHAQDQLQLLSDAKQALSDQFKSLANDILEEKSKRFTEQNQTNIGQLLDPLRQRIVEFKTRVEEIHTYDTNQQATLKAELARLSELNRQMTEEAHSLTVAFKGQSKKQGNWGELVLANVLDRSGLRPDVDYKAEKNFQHESGQRQRPDVMVYLPQNKQLIIDAKVSLNAYTRYVNADDEITRKQALKEHIKAISDRITELSDRAYYDLPGVNSPEMVFMFIPVESAFVEAVKADETLFQKALEKNVLVATPTTLLTSLNIVRQLWRFEAQNAHTAELADRAGKVYKKLLSFLTSMEALGNQLDSAKTSFEKAMGQLYTGRDNLIKQAGHFESLGVSIQTQLPEKLVEKAALELDYIEPKT
ncbi:MAG: DNA recombination protein RmuC [Burkholderiaceae bacterium]|jgi:DNA recombination protein RmuC|nr:DNA recombination protein RmuC [Burkholderiaceae bacterium]